MTQYECFNATQVAKKVCELCNLKYTKEEKSNWVAYCRELKKRGIGSDNIDYERYNTKSNQTEDIFLGYDGMFLVGIEE